MLKSIQKIDVFAKNHERYVTSVTRPTIIKKHLTNSFRDIILNPQIITRVKTEDCNAKNDEHKLFVFCPEGFAPKEASAHHRFATGGAFFFMALLVLCVSTSGIHTRLPLRAPAV